MRNIVLKIAYKGTRYAGWQIQNNAESIQAHLVLAIEAITGERANLIGSGRTDAGVHAIGQIANFYTASNMPAEKFALALNTKLPADIVVRESRETDPKFHARFSAHRKTYVYRLYATEICDPFLNDFAWQMKLPMACKGHLNLEAMRKAGAAFLGEHDFAGFMSTGSPVQSTIRRIDRLEVSEKIFGLTGTPLVEIQITGNGFLYNMVRIIAGTLADVGKNEILPEEISEIIASKDRTRAGLTAPARGLILMRVEY